MSTYNQIQAKGKLLGYGVIGLLSLTAFTAASSAARADDSYTMAPPVADYGSADPGDSNTVPPSGEGPYNSSPPSSYQVQQPDNPASQDTQPQSDESTQPQAPDSIDQPAPPSVDQNNSAPVESSSAASSVFNWKDTPANQQIPITRAVFDHGGYQLYDSVGETILVPFTHDNLYVMKFAVTQTGSMYFVNTGSAPVLYVPENGFLENATVPGAKWYPFTPNFLPDDPVYLGIAPDYSDYVSTGWYPDMDCYGGYYCDDDEGDFGPTLGFSIVFGSNSFYGWGAYSDYVAGYPAPYHLGFYRPGIYRRAYDGNVGGRSFHGAGFSFSSSGYRVGTNDEAFGRSGGHSGGNRFRGSLDGYFRGDFGTRGGFSSNNRSYRSYGFSNRESFRGSSGSNGMSFRNGGFSGFSTRGEGFRDNGASGFSYRGGGSISGNHGGGGFGGGRR